VPAALGVGTLAEFVALAKARPGLATPVTGPGSSQAVARAMFAKSADIELLNVAYKGGVSFITDLLAGTLAMSVSPVNVVGRLVKEGQLVALANTAEQRSPVLPEVPTLAEAGYPEATSVSWFGLHAPAGTPAPVLAKIAAAVRAAAADPEVNAKIAALGAEVAYLDTRAFEDFLAAERRRAEKYAAVIKAEARQ
jgi:tripartite-type tricarboxylate transporter receptor subunit TctC